MRAARQIAAAGATVAPWPGTWDASHHDANTRTTSRDEEMFLAAAGACAAEIVQRKPVGPASVI